MRRTGNEKLLNTLYVMSENGYLGLDGETIVIYDGEKEVGKVPLHNLEGIVSFGYRGQALHLWVHVLIGIFLFVI